jgi:hypothetical protein
MLRQIARQAKVIRNHDSDLVSSVGLMEAPHRK